MSTAAILIMIIVQLSFSAVTAYFFLKVLRTPQQKDQDPVPREKT
jgi:hypothetical protein